jgi:phosphoesterase RecJ-like protein
MQTTDADGIAARLRGARSALVTSHTSPDGDAVGSVLAMAEVLRGLGVGEVTCALADPVPQVYRWLPGAEDVRLGLPERMPEVVVLVDASRRGRAGAVTGALGPRTEVVIVDHHLDTEPDGDLNWVDAGYAAAGEMVVELADRAGAPLTDAAALCAYVALATDTGSFKYANTSARTHRMAARLLEHGVDASAVATRVFDLMSVSQFELMRRMVARMAFDFDGAVAYSHLTNEDMAETAATSEDVDGLVNFPRNIQRVQLAMLFRETENGETKVSMRARPGFNCAELLARFGGGGHAGAAGANLPWPLEEARANVLSHVREQFRVAL